MQGEVGIDQAFLVPLSHHIDILAIAILDGAELGYAILLEEGAAHAITGHPAIFIAGTGVVQQQRIFHAQFLEGGQHFVPVFIGDRSIQASLVQKILAQGRAEVALFAAPAVDEIKAPAQTTVGGGIFGDGGIVRHQLHIAGGILFHQIIQAKIVTVLDGCFSAFGIGIGVIVENQIGQTVVGKQQIEGFGLGAVGGVDKFHMDVGLFFQPLEHIGIGKGRNAVREERGLIDGIPAGQGDLFIRQPKVAFFVFRLYRQGGKQQRHTQHGAEEYPEVLFHWGCLLIRFCLSGSSPLRR